MNDILPSTGKIRFIVGDFNLVTFSTCTLSLKTSSCIHDEIGSWQERVLCCGVTGAIQFAGLRNLLTYRLPSGQEIALYGLRIWSVPKLEVRTLEWSNLDDQMNKKMQGFTATLNAFIRQSSALGD